jgi:hypothetical protein
LDSFLNVEVLGIKCEPEYLKLFVGEKWPEFFHHVFANNAAVITEPLIPLPPFLHKYAHRLRELYYLLVRHFPAFRFAHLACTALRPCSDNSSLVWDFLRALPPLAPNLLKYLDSSFFFMP